MERPTDNFNYTQVGQQDNTMARSFINGVFAWMFLGLLLTGLVAWVCGNSGQFIRACVNESGTGFSPFGYFVIFAPLGFSLIMGFTADKLSYFAIMGLFILFSVVMGMSLSFIFLVYELGSIYLTFGICAGLFGAMALLGYTTKTDLTRFGTLLMFGAMGIVVVSLVNFFMQSDSLSYIIGCVGVAVFSGLAAYKMQMLKEMSYQADGSEASRKMSIWGAYMLYITFINLFLSLLRLFGSRR